MDNKKRCIFHVPNNIDINRKSGSNIRPLKMIEGFKENGYIVDVIMGYGKDRKKQIKNIKDNIKNGMKYDFLYSESSTMPTLLTEKRHFPTYPFLDFSFFKYCKKYNIKIGLFYRDIYWKFPIYKEKVPLIKRCISIPMYYYDINQYNKYVNLLYLPSLKMKKYLPEINKNIRIDELPPGAHINTEYDNSDAKDKEEELTIFYVGGIGEIYDITKLLLATTTYNKVKLIICCRKEDWENNYKKYEKLLNEKVEIVHKSGKELLTYYKRADICSLFFECDKYREFSMPVKLFEYISNRIPIIATKGTVAGDFIEKNDIGWNINYNVEELIKLLDKIDSNRMILKEKKDNINKMIYDNTWKERANKVSKDLK